MAINFKNLAEHQIKKAQAEGQLDDLKGAGKPLPAERGAGSAAVGFRVMAEAGVIPREISLKKAVAAQRIKLQATKDPATRKQEMKKLADVELRLSIEAEARRKYYGG